MSLTHYVERLSADRSNLKPIQFYDEPTEELAARNQQIKETQRGIVVKLNPIQAQRLRRKKWMLQNKEKESSTRKKWIEKNSEKMKSYWRAYRQTDNYKKLVKRWRDNNREKYNAYQLNWLNENREKRRKQQRERCAARYKTDEAYRKMRSERSKLYYQKRKAKKLKEKNETVS